MKLFNSALQIIDSVMGRVPESPLAITWQLLRGNSSAIDAIVRDAITEVDGETLKDSLKMLEEMLKEVDGLAKELPDDAKPIGAAAKTLVERAISECRKERVNAARLAADVQQVAVLSKAMRERLLLSPWKRKPAFVN